MYCAFRYILIIQIHPSDVYFLFRGAESQIYEIFIDTNQEILNFLARSEEHGAWSLKFKLFKLFKGLKNFNISLFQYFSIL